MARRKTTTSQDTDASPRTSSPRYKVLVDLSYGDKRVQAGKIVTDIPNESLGWLLEGDYIKKVG